MEGMTMTKTTEPCILCDSQEIEIVSNKDRKGQALETGLCMGCGLVHSNPLPTQAELDSYYGKEYRQDYKQSIQPKPKHILRYAEGAVARIQQIMPYVKPESKILDIGSGGGEFLALCKRMNWQIEGLEPHHDYAKYTQTTYHVPTINATLEQAPIHEETYDIITIYHVLEHMRQPVEALMHMWQWLKPEGFLAIEVPNLSAHRHAPANRFHYAHIFNFNPVTFKNALHKAGFTILTGEGTTSVVAQKTHMPNRHAALRDTSNAKTLLRELRAHNTAKHYLTATPYERMAGKLKRLPRELCITKKNPEPVKIIASVHQKALS
jgi:2-polyprenyl-3-methyl-5-hydroxy-6-metoxy-1,4-benzoquinol methylase